MKNENGIERSAILKGQTLVNLHKLENYSNFGVLLDEGWKQHFGKNDSYATWRMFDISMLKPNTEYGVFCWVLENTISEKYWNGHVYHSDDTVFNPSTELCFSARETGLKFEKLTTISDFTGKTCGMRHLIDINTPSSEYVKFRCVIVEYQEGMENWDIPYFEGMQSVKMPVLTTTGKNLIGRYEKVVYRSGREQEGATLDNDGNFTYVGAPGNRPCLIYKNNPNTDITISSNVSLSGLSIYEYSDIPNFTREDEPRMLTEYLYTGTQKSITRTTSKEAKYIGISFYNDSTNTGYTNLQLEYGLQATVHEPFKSNILTTNEEVELRKVEDVQDELNLMTGEVTERIGEIVLDGSENWTNNGSSNDYIAFRLELSNFKKSSKIISDSIPVITTVKSGFGIYSGNGITVTMLKTVTSDLSNFKTWLSTNPVTIQYQLAESNVKTVDLIIQDQDNQPVERMKLFPNGYINTSSSTFPPILELKGITHNNKLNMTTTNGTNNTQLTTLDNLALDSVIIKDGTIVRDSYDVESGLYTKRVFRFTVDEEFVRKYRDKFVDNNTNSTALKLRMGIVAYCGFPKIVTPNRSNSGNLTNEGQNNNSVSVGYDNLYIQLLKEELKSYDVDGILDWIKRNGAIEIAYAMDEPQTIHMQPNMTPYVSTRPYQGSIESQGNILESSFLDYTSEQSIISPKPLGDGDVLRWEQGSQCYVYENDKEYIPLTSYNQPMGTVLDLEEEDGEQFVENLDGGDIIVDIPFKEKAVYERHLVSHEDSVIYPTQDKLDPTGKIEVDYICGETWQNPNDLSDIRHVGTLRDDGQYDVTIRRSGDDEIRLMDGTTHLSLDGDGLNPSEFELTYFNNGGVEVGKYGDTSHTLEDCVLDSKLETGTVYGETMVNVFNYTPEEMATWKWSSKDSGGVAIWGDSGYMTKAWAQIQAGKTYTMIYVNAPSHYLGFYAVRTFIDGYSQTQGKYSVFTVKDDYVEGTKANFYLKSSQGFTDEELANIQIIVVEGDYTSYSMDIPYFEGVGSTIVNGFTTVGKNLFDLTGKDFDNKNVVGTVCSLHEDVFEIKGLARGSGGRTSLGNGITFLFKKGKTYTLSIDVIENNATTVPLFYFSRYDNSSAYISTRANNNPGTITATEDVLAYIGYNVDLGVYYDCKVKVQIEYGSQAIEYEPYKSMQYTLPTPITLNKVGDVADTYDVVSGVETRRCYPTIDDINYYVDVNVKNWAVQKTRTNTILFGINDPYKWKNTGNYCWNSIGMPSENINIWDNDVEGIQFANNSDIRFSILRSELDSEDVDGFVKWIQARDIKIRRTYNSKTIPTFQHTLIPSTVETTQEPTFILPQPLRSVPNGICDRLYWDENKGHYCIEKRIRVEVFDGVNNFNLDVNNGTVRNRIALPLSNILYINNLILYHYTNSNIFPQITYDESYKGKQGLALYNNGRVYFRYSSNITNAQFKQILSDNPVYVYYPVNNSEIIDLPHLNKKLTLPTQPDTLPIGYKVECQKANPQLGLTIPYKQLNYPSRPQNIDFKMDIADYVLTWDDVKEARQYNVILNDRVIATVKEPQWNSGEEMYGYIMVEAQNELAENLSEELYIKTVPNAPAQLTVGHNPMTNYYDFEISFIKTSAIAEYYTVQYRIDGGEWVYKTIQSDEIDPNSKVLWRFSIYEINEQIEVWATATNEIGTNDILPTAIYYMSPTPQWTYRVNSKELFVRWMDESPYDTQYKLRYQYKSDGIYRYAYFEGDKQEIGRLYEALIPLADDEEVSIALCVISEKENLYTKPIRASKELDPNIKPPKNFNYHWLARGLIEFYWEDNYDVDVEYEAIVEHRLTSGNNEWITDTRIFSATDTEGTGTVYRLSYQLEDLEEIRVKVRMKWAMNETEWSESLTTVFIPVEGNPPQWIRRTQTQEGLLVEWEAQEYVDSYHVYVMSNGEELQHLETMDNFIYVDLDYSNPIDIEIYEATRFSGGIQSDPSDKMCFRPTMDKHQLIHDVVTPDTLTYEIEVDTVQKGIKERQVIHDINTTPKVTSKQPMDVSISSPFTLSFHPLQLDVHQAGAKYYGDTELHIKTLDVKSRDSIEVLTFERITDQYGVDFTVYTPSANRFPITLEVNRVRIVCFGDSLTSGHPGFWRSNKTAHLY